MKSFQFAELKKQLRNNQTITIVVLRGKHRGIVGEAQSTHLSKVFLAEIDDAIPYVNCEIADQHGKPIFMAVRDQTGREITEGSWIVYSAGGGKQAHRLEIGVVERIGDAGGLTVTRNLSNGKVAQQDWRGSTRTVNDPDRTLLLPVSEVDMTEWVLRGFTDLKEQLF